MNRRAITVALSTLLLSGGAGLAFSRLSAPSRSAGASRRLVSLSPAITETLLALNAGEQLVAVSNFCSLPPGAGLPRVGSSLTPSYEAIAGLRPSLILSDDSAGAKERELQALAPCEILPWLTLTEVVASTRRLGQLADRGVAANVLAERLSQRLSTKPPADAPRVLLLLGYDPDRPAELWFIKPNSLHGAALTAAGARNAVQDDVSGLPRLSVEELIRLDPDQVLVLANPGMTREGEHRMLSALSALAPLRAVRDGRFAVVEGSQSTGPSILGLVDALARVLGNMAARQRTGGTGSVVE